MSSSATLPVLLVSGSSGNHSATGAVLRNLAGRLEKLHCQTDLLDLGQDPLPLFDPEKSYDAPYYKALKARVEEARVLVLGTPDYHGCISSTLKNFLDHFWSEYAGKLVATVVASFEKGLTVTDQLRTFARQCQAWTLPYGVAFMDKTDVKDGEIISEAFDQRLAMLTQDLHHYGLVLSRQREADLAGDKPGFMARHRRA